MKRIRRVTILTGLLGLTMLVATSPSHAATAPFRAGVTPPYSGVQLVLDAVSANGNYTIHIERSTQVWTGRTVDFWMFMTLHPKLDVSDLGGWRQMRIDCATRAHDRLGFRGGRRRQSPCGKYRLAETNVSHHARHHG